MSYVDVLDFDPILSDIHCPVKKINKNTQNSINGKDQFLANKPKT